MPDDTLRYLEVRRHSLTEKGARRGRGSDLSREGVALARALGAALGSFDHVVASPIPRTSETAIAMGHAVDEVVDLRSGYVPGEVQHHEQWGWKEPYPRYLELIARGGGLADVANRGRDVFTRIAAALPEGGAALVISHGGTIEPILVACLPGADHAGWGAPLAHCEGARLTFDQGAFVTIEFRRIRR